MINARTGELHTTIIVCMLRSDLKAATTTLGKRIREARVRACMTQEALGVTIVLDESVACIRVSRYESGVHAPPMQLIQPLAQALSVTPAYQVTENNQIAARSKGSASYFFH